MVRFLAELEEKYGDGDGSAKGYVMAELGC